MELADDCGLRFSSRETGFGVMTLLELDERDAKGLDGTWPGIG